MRSGTGRHRRPRQAPAILVTAGVTSAGIATSLLGASGAQAVEASTWDRVAECESGGAWSLNADSGYYGGFQLTLKTWEKYGGTVFAERPDLASRGQQIEIAEKILAAEGPRAWPMCAVGSGLAEEFNEESDSTESEEEPPPPGEGGADQPGGTDGSEDDADTDRPSGPSDTSIPPTDEADKDAKPDDGSKADDPDQPYDDHDADTSGRDSHDEEEDRGGDAGSGDTSEDRGGSEAATPGSRPGTGKHRGQPDLDERDQLEGGTDEDDEHRRPGRDERADRDERGDRTDRDKRLPGVDQHLVRVGDTLSAIADEHRVAGGWPELYEANETAVGGDPDLILPGQLLRFGDDVDREPTGRTADR